MSRYLYQQAPSIPVRRPTPQPEVSVEALFDQLGNHMQAYESVQKVYAHVSSESLAFVDNKNVVLFNEYMSMLGKNFGVAPKLVSPAALESQHLATVNYELALEGWIKDMWTKIKAFFTKIFQAIKDFMTKHFTRLGRLKNKLENIKTVAGESGKEMGLARLDEVPSGLASKFKVFDNITEQEVSKAIKSAHDAVNEIKALSNETRTIAGAGIASSNFITEIKKLKDVALSANKQIDDNKAKRSELGIFKDRKERAALKDDNKSLTKIAKDTQSEADKMDDTLVKTGDGFDDSDEGHEKSAQLSFKEYLKTVVSSLEKYVNVKMVGGKTITKVSVTDDNELEVEFDESEGGDGPSSALLVNSAGVQKLAGEALEMIKSSEAQGQVYAKTNDEIMKLLSTIDSLIVDIDRNDPERYGKYRKLLDKRIRTRLNMMRVLFRSYNQVSRNFSEVAVNTGDAVVDYCVICMKNFK
jgi:hypothetical protein